MRKFDRIAFFDGLAVFTDSVADRTPPKEILLVKFGKNAYTKDGKRGEFDFTPEDADAVLSDFAVRAKVSVRRPGDACGHRLRAPDIVRGEGACCRLDIQT